MSFGCWAVLGRCRPHSRHMTFVGGKSNPQLCMAASSRWPALWIRACSRRVSSLMLISTSAPGQLPEVTSTDRARREACPSRHCTCKQVPLAHLLSIHRPESYHREQRRSPARTSALAARSGVPAIMFPRVSGRKQGAGSARAPEGGGVGSRLVHNVIRLAVYPAQETSKQHAESRPARTIRPVSVGCPPPCTPAGETKKRPPSHPAHARTCESALFHTHAPEGGRWSTTAA